MSETSLAAGSWQALTFVVCPTSGGAALAIETAIAVSSSWMSSILKNPANKDNISGLSLGLRASSRGEEEVWEEAGKLLSFPAICVHMHTHHGRLRTLPEHGAELRGLLYWRAGSRR